MEPIISPWYFYIIHVASAIQFASILISVVCLTLGTLCFIASHDSPYGDDKFGMKIAKRLLIAGAVALSLVIFVPSENTLYKMLAASLVTPENISIAENGTIDFIERLAEAIAKHIK